jgi:hypothetical protein
MRIRFPKDIQADVLLVSRRRCAFCYGLDGDTTEKEGQIVHIDRDSSNVDRKNAAFLCTKHHARYDSKSRQTKGYTPEELLQHQALLGEYLALSQSWPDFGAPPRVRNAPGVSIDVFEKRVPVYRATIKFIRTVLQINDIKLDDMFDFATQTDEALFLFDDSIVAYLALLFKRGLQLRAVALMLKPVERRTPELIQEESDLALWFSQQFEETRKRFVPFLRLARRGVK